jgi:hypothetical protein
VFPRRLLSLNEEGSIQYYTSQRLIYRYSKRVLRALNLLIRVKSSSTSWGHPVVDAGGHRARITPFFRTTGISTMTIPHCFQIIAIRLRSCIGCNTAQYSSSFASSPGIYEFLLVAPLPLQFVCPFCRPGRQYSLQHCFLELQAFTWRLKAYVTQICAR